MQRPLDDRSQLRTRVEADILLAVIAAAEADELKLASSDVLRFETENNPVPTRRDFARRVLALATAPQRLRLLIGQSAMRRQALNRSTPSISLLLLP